MSCPSDNTQSTDQSKFWDSNGLNWDKHRIGWAIAGGCALLTFIISFISILQHCRNYNNPAQQRQILRILYMPPIYAIISFLSYRFFRSYTYFSFVEVAYEAVTLSAFLLLIIEYVADTAIDHSATKAIERKDKRPLPLPFCCWRYRPTKAYFMYTVKWAVLQYVILRPAVSIAGIVCEKLNVLCESQGFNFRFANVYLEIVDFVSISVALYGLLVFYGLTSEELKGRRPLAKFLSIKLIVVFTFYQGFVFSALENRVIHGTEFWSATNVANGLSALTICIEMVFFSILMMWAYNASEHRKPGAPTTSVWRPLWDSINYSDFAAEIMGSLRYFASQMCGGSSKRVSADLRSRAKPDFGEAFGVYPYQPTRYADNYSLPTRGDITPMRPSYDDTARLEPYGYPRDQNDSTILRSR